MNLSMLGIPITTSPHLRDGEVLIGQHGRPRWVLVGTRPMPVLERARAEATHIVRSGLADVLEWLGEDVGTPPPPDGIGERLVDRLSAMAQEQQEAVATMAAVKATISDAAPLSVQILTRLETTTPPPPEEQVAAHARDSGVSPIVAARAFARALTSPNQQGETP